MVVLAMVAAGRMEMACCPGQAAGPADTEGTVCPDWTVLSRVVVG